MALTNVWLHTLADTASVGAAGPRPSSATGVPTGVDNGARTVVRFRFTPFRATEPGRHYDPECL